MIKNICKKQKAINNRYAELSRPHVKLEKNRLFSNKFLSEITMHCSKTIVNEKIGMEELLDRFIYRDSLSIIHKSKCEDVKATFCESKHIRKNIEIKSTQRSIKSPYKKPIVMTSNLLGGARVLANNSKKVYKRHESQKDISINTKVGKHQINGRASVTGDYDSHNKNSGRDKEQNIKTLTVSPTSRLISTKATLADIDPFQINIHLNLVLDKAKSRSGTPHTCSGIKMKGYLKRKESQKGCGFGAYQTQENTITRASDILKKERPNSGLDKNNTQIRLSSNKKIKLEVKLVGNKVTTGRSSAIPLQKKKLAINSLCKSIKNLLSPLGLNSTKSNTKQDHKTKGLSIPREIITIAKHHKRSGTEIFQSDPKHTSALSQKKCLLYI